MPSFSKPAWFQWITAVAEHARNGKLTRAQLLDVQQRKFRKLVRHAYDRSRYYRRVMDERRLDPDTCRVEDFPVLRKTDYLEHFDEISTNPAITRARVDAFLERSSDPRELLDDRYRVVHSSGSSGTLAIYVYDRDEWIQGCSQFLRTSPLRKLRRRVAFVGAIHGHFAGVSMMLNGTQGLNRLFFDIRLFDVGDPFSRTIAELNEFQPHTLSGYATSIKRLSEAQARGELKIAPDEVGMGSETIPAEQKREIDRVFGVRTLNVYSTCECLHMGLTLCADDYMYLMEDEIAFELFDDHICVTNLFNYTMPLIRYRFDDVLRPADDPTSPLPFRRVENVVGRSEASLVFEDQEGNEELMHPAIIEGFYVQGITRWQVEQTARDAFEFRIVYDPTLDAETRRTRSMQAEEKIGDVLSRKGLSNVRYEIKEVSDLLPDPRTGKFRIILPLKDKERHPSLDCSGSGTDSPGRLPEAAAGERDSA